MLLQDEADSFKLFIVQCADVIGQCALVHRTGAAKHLERTQNETIRERLREIVQAPQAYYPTAGAYRRFPLSTYIKKKMRGRISGFLCDELHEYNNASGQGDAMAELYGVCKLFVGMTATLINGYSSGIFHLLYRLVPGLMKKDGKEYRSPQDFSTEYGVVENTYEIRDGGYNSNRRTTKRKTRSKQLPGVSPLVYSRFLLEYTSFLSLADMGKDLPDYEEIPIPLEMPPAVHSAYKKIEHKLREILRTDRKAANRLLSTYLNLLTVYPDQPYGQKPVIHPTDGVPIVEPEDAASFDDLLLFIAVKEDGVRFDEPRVDVVAAADVGHLLHVGQKIGKAALRHNAVERRVVPLHRVERHFRIVDGADLGRRARALRRL